MNKTIHRLLTLALLLAAMTGLTSSCHDSELTDGIETVAPNESAGEPFQWTRAEDVETRHAFMRNFGVGYSYDAVRGSYCDWHDIRCQVVNRHTTLELQQGVGETLLSTSMANTVMVKGKFEYSFRDYVANVTLNTHQAIDIGLYKGDRRKRSYFIEDGIQEKFFYIHDEKIIRADCALADASVRTLYSEGHPEVLTASFRNAIEHLKQTSDQDIAAVDSFINVWGTHVITQAWLGGTLRVDLMNDLWRYNDLAKDEEFTTHEFLWAVQGKDERRTGKEEYKWLEHGRLNITARGGDQTTLNSLLGEHRPDGTRTFSLDGIERWRTSVNYDPADEAASTAELVDMRVVPIWEFADVVDPFVALRIKAAVLQDAALQQELIGETNFFDTAFPIRHPSASCRYRERTDAWQTVTRTDSPDEPMVVNIVSGGRYVATVCHETIGGMNLWVCYPIYDGRIKLQCGVAVADDGTAYDVLWQGSNATLTKRADKAADGNFYINAGDVDVVPCEGRKYADAHVMPYIELSGGIRPDGSYTATPYSVRKQDSDFTIHAPEGLPDIVGYTFTDGLYKRTANYVYIYNNNEINYD